MRTGIQPEKAHELRGSFRQVLLVGAFLAVGTTAAIAAPGAEPLRNRELFELLVQADELREQVLHLEAEGEELIDMDDLEKAWWAYRQAFEHLKAREYILLLATARTNDVDTLKEIAIDLRQTAIATVHVEDLMNLLKTFNR